MRRLRLCARLLCEERGVSAIEFAFIAPVIAVLIIGIIDFGMGLWRQMEVANAAEAGAAYAAAKGWNSPAGCSKDPACNIENAETSATSLSSISTSPPTGATPTWPPWCGCPPSTGNGGITPVTPCGSVLTCPNPNDGSPGHYVTVYASITYHPILPWPGIGTAGINLSSTANARLYP